MRPPSQFQRYMPAFALLLASCTRAPSPPPPVQAPSPPPEASTPSPVAAKTPDYAATGIDINSVVGAVDAAPATTMVDTGIVPDSS
jgi:hypothetical protein